MLVAFRSSVTTFGNSLQPGLKRNSGSIGSSFIKEREERNTYITSTGN